jgi:hypothetical protein
MAITTFPLDKTSYTANALGAWLGTRTRGVYSADDNLWVVANGNMTITVKSGLAWLRKSKYWGVAVLADADTTLTIPTADAMLARCDAVSLVLDKAANTSSIVLRSGTPAMEPLCPAIRQNDDYDEVYLASIRVPAGATQISASNITDLRTDEAYCGLMRDGVTGLPTSAIRAQTDALLAQVQTELANINAGTEAMLRTTYDPQGKSKDIYAYADGKVASGVISTGVSGLSLMHSGKTVVLCLNGVKGNELAGYTVPQEYRPLATVCGLLWLNSQTSSGYLSHAFISKTGAISGQVAGTYAGGANDWNNGGYTLSGQIVWVVG